MSYEDADAEVLNFVSRRLFSECHTIFREAHGRGVESFDALTIDEFLSGFGEALEQERLALEKQREAVLLQREALSLRAKGWAKREAVQGGELLKN